MKILVFRFVMIAAFVCVHFVVPTSSFANQAEVIGECQISQWDDIRRYQLKIAHEPTEFADLFINAVLVPDLERDEQNVWQMARAGGMDIDSAISEHIDRFSGGLDSDETGQLRVRLENAVAPAIALRNAISVAYFTSFSFDEYDLEADARRFGVSPDAFEARISYWMGQGNALIFDDAVLAGVALYDVHTERQIADGVNPSMFPTRGGCAFFNWGFRYAQGILWDHAKRQYPVEAAVLEDADFGNRVIQASWIDVFGPYRR